MRKASVEERNGKRYGGNIVEIACEKHRWRRAAGRDGRCGWERGWEKWKERDAGKIVDIARKKHVEKRYRGTCDMQSLRKASVEERNGKRWRKNRGNTLLKASVEKRCGKRRTLAHPTLTNG